PALPVREARLEDFDEDAGQWNALLFQESAQYIDPMALFEAAGRLLADGPASLIVIDEFALRRQKAEHTGLHQLEHFCALAERFGWRLTAQQDLSSEVQPTVGYLRRATDAHRARLIDELGVSAEMLDGLQDSNARYAALYAAGVYGYALLRFERSGRALERVATIDAGGATALRDLFGKVFGHAMTREHQHWKYGDGRGTGVGLVRDGQLLAHYGGLSREAVFRGQRVRACQVCDVMVAKEARHALTRRGPLHKVTASFLERQIGWGLPHLIGYGFPTDRAFAAAEQLGLYASVDSMVRVCWPARRRPRFALTPVVQRLTDAAALEAPGPLARSVDACGQRMIDSLPDLTMAVRDARWLAHRYLRHPGFEYEVWLLRRRLAQNPIGVVVLRRHEQHLEWVDALAPVSDWQALLAHARHRATELGLPGVEAWITRSQQRRLVDLDGAATVADLGIQVPTNTHTAGPDPRDLRDTWLLMAGDTDFR
ncbi:MAG: GNAT family N-acetyltransferase, partial [Burkholderiales bacterium]|nr:GNAT family N-acetyltransferase [Burkholderiales bacterium]